MPASEQKIITKLRERRQIESGLHRMRAVSSRQDLRRQALEIASSGSQVIPAIVSNLDRADSEMVLAMGTVATYLDRDAVIKALQRAVRQPERSDRGRWAAMAILERFLGEPLDAELMASLVDPGSVAVSSLETVLSRAENQPTILVEFVQDLDQQEPDVVLEVVLALWAMKHLRTIEPLRMMAQDVREEIAAEALQALGSIYQPQAANALQSLIPTAAPPLRPLAERLLRKLMFAGVEVQVLTDPLPEWRALVSPIDGRGQRSVWFLQESRGTSHARFLNVLLSDRAGAAEAAGHGQVSTLALPPRRSMGYVHDITLPGSSGVMLMLETSFNVGRRLVLEALDTNRETQIPVAGALRLFGSWLWSVGGADRLPPRQLPALGDSHRSQRQDADRLLGHPAFSTWTLKSEALLQETGQAQRILGWEEDRWVKRLVSTMFSGTDVPPALGRRLASMSEWLLLAGEEALSCLALRSAQEILVEGAQEHPFVQALIRRDLDLAVET
jgi:hypothetical protein